MTTIKLLESSEDMSDKYNEYLFFSKISSLKKFTQVIEIISHYFEKCV
jgi:hypothetical protein